MDPTDIYNSVAHYPIPIKPILYRPVNLATRQVPYRVTTIDEIIQYNVMSLVPNVELGVFNQQSFTSEDGDPMEELRTWLTNSEIYMDCLQTKYMEACSHQRKLLGGIIRQKKGCAALNMQYLSRMPLDIRRHIHSFLLPETRILLYLDKYPDLGASIKRNPNSYLKPFYRNLVQKKYCGNLIGHRFNNYPNYSNSVPCHFSIKTNPLNKNEYVEEMNKLLDVLRKVPPITSESYDFFQRRALGLLKQMVYVGKHHNVRKSSETKNKK